MRNDEKFWSRWIFHYSIGELVGIGIAAIIARLLYIGYSEIDDGQSPTLNTFVLVVAGTLEGLIMGYVQWRSLSRVIGSLKPAPWIITTTLSSAIGWLLIFPPAVLIIFFFARLSAHTQYTSVLYTLLAGLTFGGLIGICQFFIIRNYFNNAIIWFFANAISWALSFLILYFALSFVGAVLINTVVIILACLASGLAQGMVTGTSLYFLMRVKNYRNSQHHIDSV